MALFAKYNHKNLGPFVFVVGVVAVASAAAAAAADIAVAVTVAVGVLPPRFVNFLLLIALTFVLTTIYKSSCTKERASGQ